MFYKILQYYSMIIICNIPYRAKYGYGNGYGSGYGNGYGNGYGDRFGNRLGNKDIFFYKFLI